MDTPWLTRLVNAPAHEVQRKIEAAKGNKKKQARLEAAGAKRKRDLEEQEDQEDDEEDQEATSSNTPAAPATSASRGTPKTNSRNQKKQQNRSARTNTRRVYSTSQPTAAQSWGQPSMPATPQGFAQGANIAPQMPAYDFHPAAQLAPEVGNAQQFYGATNAWGPSNGTTVYASPQQALASNSFQGPAPGFDFQQPYMVQQADSVQQRGFFNQYPGSVQQPGFAQQPGFFDGFIQEPGLDQQPPMQNNSEQTYGSQLPIHGNAPPAPAYGNYVNNSTPQANAFGAPLAPVAPWTPSEGFEAPQYSEPPLAYSDLDWDSYVDFEQGER